MREMLVIEGDEEATELYAAIFTQPGWNIDAAHNGRGVAEILLGSKHYNITLVSYHFPGTKGMEIIRLICELEHPQTVPALMVTGRHNVTGDALQAGANEVLLKPFVPSILVGAVTGHLSASACPVARGSIGPTSREGRSSLER